MNHKTVQITTEQEKEYYRALLNQGRPEFFHVVEHKHTGELLSAVNLKPSHEPGDVEHASDQEEKN